MIGTGIPPRHLAELLALSYDRGQLYGLRRSRQGRPPRTRGSLQAFGAGLGCLWLRGIPSADFLHAGPSAAQPALERLQRWRGMLRFGVFLTAFRGADGHIVHLKTAIMFERLRGGSLRVQRAERRFFSMVPREARISERV